MKRAAVIGSLNVDVVLKVDKLPQKGETINAVERKIFFGGKGANQALAIGRLGGEVAMVGKVGGDKFGQKLIEELRNSGVNTEGVFIDEHEMTGSAYITVDDIGENTIVFVGGANTKLSVNDVEKSKKILFGADILVMQMEIPTDVISYIINIAHSLKKQVILNFAPVVDFDGDILEKIDFLIINEVEMLCLINKYFSNKNNNCFEEGLNLLRRIFPGDIILTLGKNGSVWFDRKGRLSEFPAFSVKAVDSTGSGDAFIGGFVYGQLVKRSIKDSIVVANAAGALAVTKVGAQQSIPYEHELKDFLKRQQL